MLWSCRGVCVCEECVCCFCVVCVRKSYQTVVGRLSVVRVPVPLVAAVSVAEVAATTVVPKQQQWGIKDL
jgi:hypothetical protein